MSNETKQSIDKLVKINIWLLKKYRNEIMSEFKDIIKDEEDEFVVNELVLKAIYTEVNSKMPKYWYEYGQVSI